MGREKVSVKDFVQKCAETLEPAVYCMGKRLYCGEHRFYAESVKHAEFVLKLAKEAQDKARKAVGNHTEIFWDEVSKEDFIAFAVKHKGFFVLVDRCRVTCGNQQVTLTAGSVAKNFQDKVLEIRKASMEGK